MELPQWKLLALSVYAKKCYQYKNPVNGFKINLNLSLPICEICYEYLSCNLNTMWFPVLSLHNICINALCPLIKIHACILTLFLEILNIQIIE